MNGGRHVGTRYLCGFLLLVAVLAVVVSGCGGGEEGDGTTAGEEPATVTGTISTAAGIDDYARDMRDLAANADRVNSDYSNQADRKRAGEIETAALIDRAREGEREFQIMFDELEDVEPPEGLEDAHAQLTTAMGKWLEFYRLQISGLENNDAAQLDQAIELDNQAVAEANQAIETINSHTTVSE